MTNINTLEVDLYNPFQIMYYIMIEKISATEGIKAYNNYLSKCKDNGEWGLIKVEYDRFIDMLKARSDNSLKILNKK